LVVLNTPKYNESSPFYERINLNLPDPVQKQVFLLHNPEASSFTTNSSSGARGSDTEEEGNESTHKRALTTVSRDGIPSKKARSTGVVLFPKNPEPMWGPKKSTGTTPCTLKSKTL
jgi:hypothetical protein